MATSYPTQRRRFGLAAAVETTYGTDEVPTFAADAVRLADPPTVSLGSLAPNTREGWSTGGLGELAMATPSGLLHSVEGVRPVMQGGGAAYDDSTVWPSAHSLLLGAGFSATVDTTPASETVTYDFNDAADSGLSIYTEVDGKKFATVGAVAEAFTFGASAGEFVIGDATYVGIHSAITEVELEAATYPTALPPVFKSASFTIGSFTPVIRSFELDLGLTIALRGDGNATNAHAGYRIIRRQPRVRVVLEVDSLTNYNPWDDKNSSTQRTINFTIGATQYNQFSIDIDDARVMEVTPQDDGLSLLEVEYGVFTPSTGNELQIVFD
jgi:hypothetical protein